MARANTYTQLSLDRFFELIGMHPLHGNQVMLHDIAEVKTCGMPILQYSWQDAQRVGREEIAQAIFDAERQIAQWTNFDVGPRWNEGEEAKLGLNMHIKTGMKYLIEGGKRAKTLVSAGVPVVYSDVDGDGYKETATANVVTSFMDEELAVYYPGKAGADEWQIRGARSVGGVITMKRHLLVAEQWLEGFDVGELDGKVDSNFLGVVDVYRVYNDVSKQVEYVWEYSNCLDGDCTMATSNGCLKVVNSELGIASVNFAKWDGVNWVYDCPASYGWPSFVRLWYKAGLVKDMQQWERAVAYLALTMLDNPICSCSKIEAMAKWWRTDLALIVRGQGIMERQQLSKMALNSPLGTTRAGLYVWNLITNNYVNDHASV